MSNWTKINDLVEGTTVANVVGVVLNYKEPRQSRGTDLMMNITISDDHSNSFERYISVNIFREQLEDFPPISKKGQVIYLQKIKIKRFENTLQGISSFKFGFALFDYKNDSKEKDIVIRSKSENISVISDALKNEAREMLFSFINSSLNVSGLDENLKSPFSTKLFMLPTYTVSQLTLKEEKFNFIGEIICILESLHPNQVTVVLCDYSECKFVFCDPQMLKLPSCFPLDDHCQSIIGKNTLVVCTFWDQNVAVKSDCLVGDILLCKSMHCKVKADAKYLSFSLHGDFGVRGDGKKSYETLCIADDRSTPLLSRRRKIITPQQAINDDINLKMQNKAVEEQYICQSRETTSLNKRHSNDQHGANSIQLLLKKPKLTISKRFHFSLKQLEEFRDLPVKFVCKFKIINIFPKNYDKIAKRFCKNCQEIFGDVLLKSCPACKHLFDALSFGFSFVMEIEEGDVRIFVFVDRVASKYLLEEISPTNLSKDFYSLQLVKDRLGLLIDMKVELTGLIAAYTSTNSHNAIVYKLVEILSFEVD